MLPVEYACEIDLLARVDDVAQGIEVLFLKNAEQDFLEFVAAMLKSRTVHDELSKVGECLVVSLRTRTQD